MRWAGVVLALCLLVPMPVAAAHGDGARININTADVATLDTLAGIGEVLAERIVDYREANGLFTVPEDITNVSGIGPQSYADIKAHITVDYGTAADGDTATTTQSDTTTETVFNTVTQYQYETVYR